MGWLFIGTIITVSCLLLESNTVSAELIGADWINGKVAIERDSDYVYSNNDTYTLGNIPQGIVTAERNVGTISFPRVVEEQRLAYPNGTGYLTDERYLPFGESRWQVLYSNPILSAQSHHIPNPTTNATLLFVNEYDYYHGRPRSIRYVSDWRSLYSNVYFAGDGHIHRNAVSGADYSVYPSIKGADGGDIGFSVAALSYSKNGRWAYMNTSSGQIVVELPSLQWKRLDESININYSLSTAVSNSGRFAARGSYEYSTMVYDTMRCTETISCQKRDIGKLVQDFYASTLKNPKSITRFSPYGLHFLNESTLEYHAYVVSEETKGMAMRFLVHVDPGSEQTRYLALGDSFSSGEGVGDYYSVTAFYADATNYNICHQSKKAYSEILNTWLAPEWYDSVACSGAQIKDIAYMGDDSEYTERGEPQSVSPIKDDDFYSAVKLSFRPGYLPQKSYLGLSSPNIATITIGGNDIGFASIIQSCVFNAQCYSSRDERERTVDLIDSKLPSLEKTYRTILENMRGDSPKLYVLGYPQLFNDEKACGSVMSPAERRFANDLVDYLNDVIRIAAQRAGARYIDTTTVFIDYNEGKDYRVCGGAQPAVNGLSIDLDNMSDNQPFFDYVTSSYHPNKLGHVLLAQRVKAYTNNFSRTMPKPVNAESKPDKLKYETVVGDTLNTQNDIIQLDTISTVTAVYGKSQPVDIAYSFGENQGLPRVGTVVTMTVQSEPITLGTAKIKADHSISETYRLPESLNPGIHTLHLKYIDITGTHRDILQYFYVFADKNDLDGDGIVNKDEKCAIGSTINSDYDEDGVDDACDADITDKPSAKQSLLDAPSETVYNSDPGHAQRSKIKPSVAQTLLPSQRNNGYETVAGQQQMPSEQPIQVQPLSQTGDLEDNDEKRTNNPTPDASFIATISTAVALSIIGVIVLVRTVRNKRV